MDLVSRNQHGNSQHIQLKVLSGCAQANGWLCPLFPVYVWDILVFKSLCMLHLCSFSVRKAKRTEILFCLFVHILATDTKSKNLFLLFYHCLLFIEGTICCLLPEWQPISNRKYRSSANPQKFLSVSRNWRSLVDKGCETPSVTPLWIKLHIFCIYLNLILSDSTVL